MSVNSRTLTVEFLTKFIEIYESHPALWRVKSREYLNRHLKKQGYEELIALCQTEIPTADHDFVVRKINSMRGAFRKENKKVQKSLTDSNSEYVYVPNLWYFNLLMFTANQEEDSNHRDDLSSDDSEKTKRISLRTRESRHGGKFSSPTKKLRPLPLKSPIPGKSVKSTPKVPVPITASTVSQQLKADDEYDALGFVIATKLRKMKEDQRIHAEFLINQIIHNGLLNQLSADTTIEYG